MKIVILNGSPRENGSTSKMIQAFTEGAEESGNEVITLNVGRMNIAGCRGCEYCHTNGNGNCIQRDDEEQVYRALKEAEMLILASPIYYFTLTAQLQAAIHRTYAIGIPPKVRQTALFLSSGSPDVYNPAINQYRYSIVDYFKVKDLGVITVNETDNKVEDNFKKILEFGRSIH